MSATVRVDTSHLAYAAAVVEAAVRSGSHACAVVAVANRDETLWTHVVSGEDRVERDTIFLLASITKPILATAVMQLVEEGKLALNKPVADYLPEFGVNGKQGITTRHLLTHTSGMSEARWATSRFGGEEEIGPCFEEACATHLNFAPGAHCEYCTLSFAVMAELIGRLSGQPYPDYLRDRVFAPAGMSDTSFRPHNGRRAAPVHNFEEASLAAFIERAVAGGGLWSTAADLVKFGQAYLRGSHGADNPLLSPAAVAMMTRDHNAGRTTTPGAGATPFPYGFGWGKPYAGGETLCSERAYEHGGATGTLLSIDPEWDLVYVFLTNRWGQEGDTPRRALNAVYGALHRELAE